MATYPARTRRWTRAEYERLIDIGVFRADEPLELLGGELIVSEPQNSAHYTAIGLVEDALRAALEPGWLVRSQGPIALDDESEPEPDVAVTHGARRRYSRQHPSRPALVVETVDIAKPIGREVLVRTVASGVCHSDLHFVDGYYQFPAPAILGHEAAGIVEEVGPHVTEFKPGDHVIACLSVFCGHCSYCLTGRTHLCQSRPVRTPQEPPKLSWNGAPVNQFANLSAYAEKMLVHENGLVKVRDDMPLDRSEE